MADVEEVRDAEKELETLRLGKSKIETMVTELQEEVKTLTIQHNIYHTRRHNLRFEFEKIFIRRQTAAWWFVVLLSAALVLHCYSHQVYVFCFINAYAFLINWKSLYVKEVSPPKGPVGVFKVIALTHNNRSRGPSQWQLF